MTNFGGSDQVVEFNELYEQATVTIWPPVSEADVYTEFANWTVTTYMGGTVVREAVPNPNDVDSPVADWLLAIPGQRCFVEVSAEDNAVLLPALQSLRQIDLGAAAIS